jgi:hypothetical protein
MDMFVVPTISFGLLNGLVILRQSRRELLWLMRNARQPTEACGWDEPPRYLIRDRGGAYGAAFIRRIRAMGIRDRPKVGRLVLHVCGRLRPQNLATFLATLRGTKRKIVLQGTCKVAFLDSYPERMRTNF